MTTMFSPKLKAASSNVIAYIGLKHRQTLATSDSEREDIAVEIQNLRAVSVPVSLINAVADIHDRQPILLPLICTVLALKLAFL